MPAIAGYFHVIISYMNEEGLVSLVNQLIQQPTESECVEFKENCGKELGEYISALANAAALYNKEEAYLIFGIDDTTHEVVGTQYSLSTSKEMSIRSCLEPRVDFSYHDIVQKNKRVMAFVIKPAVHYPVKFKGKAFIRINSSTTELASHPDKEKLLWRKLDQQKFETNIAKGNLSPDDVLALLDYASFFRLSNRPLPGDKDGIVRALLEAGIIKERQAKLQIANLGAVLFANDLTNFDDLSGKGVRFIYYSGNSNTNVATFDKIEQRGYAIVFNDFIELIGMQVPTEERIDGALRTNKPRFPIIAIREFVANALIHQDFSIYGSRPMVELYDNRLEITNPGQPLIDTSRFIDHMPVSRNDKIATTMRLLGICEERGSGVDRAINACEQSQLPAPNIISDDDYTRVIIYAEKPFAQMSMDDRVRAAYQHCCLCFVNNTPMTNESLRKRLSIESKNYPMASRVIREATARGIIKLQNPDSRARRYYTYIPFWA